MARSAPSSSPQGIEISQSKTSQWRVGAKIGSGACASVHVLENMNASIGADSQTTWAIKIAPRSQKTTKKRNSPSEINERLIHLESIMYQNHFQSIQGTFVPRLPNHKEVAKVYGELDEYKYLIMEKMQSPLESIVPELEKIAKRTTSISFGPIASQLLKCVEAIHSHNHLVIDVKPDNFMLSSDSGRGRTAEDKLASKIRLLDLALVKPWTSIMGNRTNDGGNDLVGTPMYASLNVHAGETPSRRDDLEALGYVIAELISKISSGNIDKELPWCHGKSDEAIWDMKREQVDDVTSAFYMQLGSGNAIQIMKEYLDTVRAYSFKKAPDYDDLLQLLSALKIPISTNVTMAKRGKTKSTQAVSTQKSQKTPPISTSGRLTRSQARQQVREQSELDDDLPHKISCGKLSMDMEAELNVEDISDDPMDWEPIMGDENASPLADSKPKPLKGVTLIVSHGPEKGTAVNLIQGIQSSLIVGRNPVTKKGDKLLSLSKDERIDNSHCKIELVVSKKIVAVEVTDLKSSAGTYNGSEKIKKKMKVFRGGTIAMGDSILTVTTLDAGKVSVTAQQDRPIQIRPSAMQRSVKSMEVIEIEEDTDIISQLEDDDDDNELVGKRNGLQIRIIDGPHTGDKFILEENVSEMLTLGTKPSGTGRLIALPGDDNLQATHVQLKLYKVRKSYGLYIIDKSGGGTKINDMVPKGKGRALANDLVKIGDTTLQLLAL